MLRTYSATAPPRSRPNSTEAGGRAATGRRGTARRRAFLFAPLRTAAADAAAGPAAGCAWSSLRRARCGRVTGSQRMGADTATRTAARRPIASGTANPVLWVDRPVAGAMAGPGGHHQKGGRHALAAGVGGEIVASRASCALDSDAWRIDGVG